MQFIENEQSSAQAFIEQYKVHGITSLKQYEKCYKVKIKLFYLIELITKSLILKKFEGQIQNLEQLITQFEKMYKLFKKIYKYSSSQKELNEAENILLWMNMKTIETYQLKSLEDFLKNQQNNIFNLINQIQTQIDEIISTSQSLKQENALSSSKSSSSRIFQDIDLTEELSKSILQDDISFKKIQNGSFIESPNTVYWWSEELKAEKNQISQLKITKCLGQKWENSALFTLCEPNISALLNSDSMAKIKVRFKQIQSGDVAIGVCLKNVLQKKKFTITDEMEDVGHGCFMMTNKGRVYSDIDPKLNCQKKGFKFNQGDELTLFVDKKLHLYISKNSQTCKLFLYEGQQSKNLHFAVHFTGHGDCVEIVNQEQS